MLYFHLFGNTALQELFVVDEAAAEEAEVDEVSLNPLLLFLAQTLLHAVQLVSLLDFLVYLY